MNDVIKWINDKILHNGADKIEINDIDDIKDFTLLWNLFEAIFCNKNANMYKIDNIIDRHIDKLIESDYQKTFEYFYDRYKNDDVKFRALKLTKPYQNLVKKVLDDTFTDKNNRLKFIMAIIYRYRNNLFHGEKDMRYIKLQKENFEKTNEFLMSFIEACKEQN
jgi:hypothetical protein